MSEKTIVDTETHPTKQSSELPIPALYGNSFVFELRYIFTDEQDEVSERFTANADLEGREKTRQNFTILLDALVKFSRSIADGEKARKEFGEFTPRNERILNTAYRNFISANSGGSVFL